MERLFDSSRFVYQRKRLASRVGERRLREARSPEDGPDHARQVLLVVHEQDALVAQMRLDHAETACHVPVSSLPSANPACRRLQAPVASDRQASLKHNRARRVRAGRPS